MTEMSSHEAGVDIELFVDGDGVAIVGEMSAVERFVHESGLSTREFPVAKARSVMGSASAAAQGVATIQQNFGRWVKLTEGSAKQIANNPLMKGSTDAVARAIVVDGSKKTKHIVEFVKMELDPVSRTPELRR